jgi:hypothetical protein
LISLAGLTAPGCSSTEPSPVPVELVILHSAPIPAGRDVLPPELTPGPGQIVIKAGFFFSTSSYRLSATLTRLPGNRLEAQVLGIRPGVGLLTLWEVVYEIRLRPLDPGLYRWTLVHRNEELPPGTSFVKFDGMVVVRQ